MPRIASRTVVAAADCRVAAADCRLAQLTNSTKRSEKFSAARRLPPPHASRSMALGKMIIKVLDRSFARALAH